MDDETETVLRSAGWEPTDRGSSEDLLRWKGEFDGLVFHRAAEAALNKFGGVKVQIGGPGEAMARQSFELNPSLALGDDDLFYSEGDRLDKPLFPLGEGGGGQYYLAIADDGFVYALGFECIDQCGDTIEDAIENLVHGRSWHRLFGS